MPLLRDVDILVLRMINNRSTIQEIQAALGLRSPSTAHKKILRLEELGLVTPPPMKKMARSRVLTDLGKGVLSRYEREGSQPSST
jgi:SOS-response transcriptional repressor LexA